MKTIKENCKTCKKSVRYKDGVLKEGAYQIGQGWNKPLLSFCNKECLKKHENNKRIRS